jgi:hypothetical protein
MFSRFFNPPQPLPTGMTEFNEWFERIKAKTGLPTVDDDSLKFALANQIMHCSPTSAKISDEYFVNALRKTAANQVASQVFMDVKQRQKEAQEAAAKAEQPVEATTALAIVADAEKT